MENSYIMDFWYVFDNFFNPRFRLIKQPIYDALKRESLLLPLSMFHRLTGKYPQGYENYSHTYATEIKLLAYHQLRIIKEQLHEDEENEIRAFLYFGQGLLFDERRSIGQKVHMMDEGFGYQRWHAFIRTAVEIGEDYENWLRIDRYIGLAFRLHSELNPKQDEHNKPDERIANKYKEEILQYDVHQLDELFYTEELSKVYTINFLNEFFNKNNTGK
jgi:hypothetical protein